MPEGDTSRYSLRACDRDQWNAPHFAGGDWRDIYEILQPFRLCQKVHGSIGRDNVRHLARIVKAFEHLRTRILRVASAA